MKLEAVYHRTSDNYSYPLNEEDLIINLKTGHDIEKVYIYYGDPFENGILGGNWKWSGVEEEIIYRKNLTRHIWWTTTVKPQYKRCKYYFKLVSGNQSIYYFEDGFYTEHEMNHQGKSLSYFTFPWMNAIDINTTPDWVNNTVWYQIFPERFCNGDTGNDPEGTKPWGFHRVTNEEYYGGDLQGIIDRLDYLQDLGINGIYLTPIFEAGSSHKYDTTDYKRIDPHFGDEKVFKTLVDKAHEKGIRIMLDGVFNHCGKSFAPWLDVLEHGPESKYYNWFMINKWPFDKGVHNTKDGSFYSFAFTPRMPKLNTNNTEVNQYLLDIVEYWVKNFDIDGLRLDVANEVSHRFCKELRRLTKAIKPDFYLLGEIWHDAMTWLTGDEFDAVMNYPLATSITDFWLYPEKTSYDFECSINHNFTMYMQQTNNVLFNLLDSHDTNRLIDKVKDIDIFYQQLALLFTMPGSPCIYYGTEFAMEGSYDPDCRRCMPWEEIASGLFAEKIEKTKSLINLRKSNNAFKSKHFHFIEDKKDKRIIHLIKTDEDHKQVEVILNCSEQEHKIERKGNELFSLLAVDTILKPKGVYIQQI
ncbi:glycoside hydrolase family 13 protein [Anaerocolumna sp. AGMB13020]|uniref:glycoside hydrolase family 13 protein n=1 Tax=Anaerocolumna sp. AGMB13020 TaxID=3081750 RepID=UPI002953A574|nr:glycoside hydrolase family 13 protein [Anaerocolumna sp. AGMB13020]WOO34531.1 glycoside hydrolase family 13 protein [Anaerocolumna sp. AGMB13020]